MNEKSIFKKIYTDYKNKNFLSVIQFAENIVLQDIEDFEILNLIGMAYDQQALLEQHEVRVAQLQSEAIKIAKMMQDRWPQQAKGYRLLGLVSQHQGNSLQAVEFYKNAYELNPEDPTIFLSLGNGYRANKQYDLAEMWYEKALAIENLKPYALQNLAALKEEVLQSNFKTS